MERRTPEETVLCRNCLTNTTTPNTAQNDARLKSFGETWAARHFRLHDQTNFSMNVMAYDGDALSFKLSYDRRRFDRGGVERVASLFQALLEGMAANPGATAVPVAGAASGASTVVTSR